jgi:GNAT superfamily N-acetyltransferase
MHGIRFAQEADVPEIFKLIRELAAYEKLTHEVIATEGDLRRYLFGSTRFAEVLLAEVPEGVAGFALFFHNFSTFVGRPGIYLEDLFVRPAYRRRGIGRSLFQRLAQIAIDRQCGRLEWAVLDWNTPAWDFYRSLGACPLTEWTIHRLTDESIRRLAQSTVG